MIRSGIAPIDDLLGGFRPGGTYLLTGGTGSGKSICCLQFANAGLRRGERVAMLVFGRSDDVRARASFLGIDLSAALREGRLLLLRYRSDFARRVANAVSADRVLEDLQRIMGSHRAKRIVLDSFAPLLDDGSPIAAASLAEFLERSGSTALLTHAGDLRLGYDRRLEPIVQAAAGVLRLAHDEHGIHRVEALSLRHAAVRAGTASFVIRPREGVTLIAAPRDPSFPVLEGGPLLLVHTTAAPPDDLLASLRTQREVIVQHAAAADRRADVCAIVVETDHTTLDAARALVRDWQRESESASPPILVAVRFNLRSIDRARLLRDGADEVLAGDMGAPELLQRLSAALRRGHLPIPPLATQEDERLTQLALAGASGELLDGERLARAISAQTARDDATPFALLRFTAAPADLDALGDVALRSMRIATGDLAARVGEAIVVYLHGARRRDIAPFLERVRERYVIGEGKGETDGAFVAESACYPADTEQVRQLVEPLEVS